MVRYLEQVLPSEYGSPQPPLFLLTPSFWRGQIAGKAKYQVSIICSEPNIVVYGNLDKFQDVNIYIRATPIVTSKRFSQFIQLSKFVGSMLHAHPAHKVRIYHKSSLAIDYLERAHPLKSPVT